MSIKAIKNELVVNWHITEACNYNCQYCYAHWENNAREILHNAQHVDRLLHNLAEYFHRNVSRVPDSPNFHDNTIRLNLAGGEPFLYPNHLATIVRKARSLDMKVSCITNGSKLTPEIIEQITPYLSVLGISVDSAVPSTNNAIGRRDKGGVLRLATLRDLIQLIRTVNPELQLKMNTVVNEVNWTENMNTLIDQCKPDKWKIFKVLPVCGDALIITDREYHCFLKRHDRHHQIITAENNDAMTHSYLMIDPLGRFYQNRTNKPGYEYSDPILDVGVGAALEQIKFSMEKFVDRYQRHS